MSGTMKAAGTVLLTFAALIFVSVSVTASESAFPLQEMTPDLDDKASLQRGARTYMNYCLGCHSLKYQRYERTANDLEIPHDLMLEHLVFDPDTRIGGLIENTMTVENAKVWFGAAPPDLTLYTSLKGGPEYIYTYLKSFYSDRSRPFGMNNQVFENVGMPHVLLDLQGIQNKVCEGESCTLELIVGSGSQTAEEYDQTVYDLSNFLYYVSEPTRQERERLGVYVLLFLAFFFVFTYLLGREYTKEFH
jgi:cytochrome c1